jgi:hypothetical protein
MQTPAKRPRVKTGPAAEYASCSKSYLEKARLTGDGPPYSKIGKAVVYDLAGC